MLGKWKWINENKEETFYIIDYKNLYDLQEISVTILINDFEYSKFYQIGTLNYERISSDEVIVSIVLECNSNFTSFTINRLGPSIGSNW
jgi:hypothetical protein